MPCPCILSALAALGTGAAAAGSAIGSAAGAAGSAIGSAAGAAGSAIGSAGSAIGSAASEVGSGLSAAGGAVGSGLGTASGSVLPALKAAGKSGIGQIDSALTQLGSQAGQLGKMGIPETDFFTNLAAKGASALDKVSSALGPSSAEASGPQAAVQAVPPVNSAPKQSLIQQASGMGGSPSSSGGQPPLPDRSAQEAPPLQDLAGMAGPPVQLPPRKDPMNLTEYGLEPDRYAAKNPGSKWLVNAANSIPGVDLALNAGRRVVDAYLGNPKMQAAKLRILDESALGKTAADLANSRYDFLADVTGAINSREGAYDRGVLAGQNAQDRVDTQTEAKTGQVGMGVAGEATENRRMIAYNHFKNYDTLSPEDKEAVKPLILEFMPDFNPDDSTWWERWKDKGEQIFNIGAKTLQKVTGGVSRKPSPQYRSTPPKNQMKPGKSTKGREQDALDKILSGGSL